MTDIVEFSPGRRIPLEHGRIEWDGNRVIRFEQLRLNGYGPKMGEKGRSPDGLIEWLGPNGRFLLVEDYRYDGEQLREIDCYGEVPGLGPHRYVDRVVRDEDGRVVAIDRTWANGQSQAVYRIRRKGQSLDQLRTAAVAELVPAVVDAVSAAVPRGERVYCIELSYQAAGRYHPPLVTLGLERVRSALREPDLAFRPLLSGGRTVELPDPDALEACRQLDQEVMSRGRWQIGTRMLREAAAELKRHDWGTRSTSPTTSSRSRSTRRATSSRMPSPPARPTLSSDGRRLAGCLREPDGGRRRRDARLGGLCPRRAVRLHHGLRKLPPRVPARGGPADVLRAAARGNDAALACACSDRLRVHDQGLAAGYP